MVACFVNHVINCFKELRVITIVVQLQEDHQKYKNQENDKVCNDFTCLCNAICMYNIYSE